MYKTISVNKYEYDQRMVIELNEKILKLEQELKTAKGFTNILKRKLKLRKLYKQINIHGQETFEFETVKNSQ